MRHVTLSPKSSGDSNGERILRRWGWGDGCAQRGANTVSAVMGNRFERPALATGWGISTRLIRKELAQPQSDHPGSRFLGLCSSLLSSYHPYPCPRD